MWELRKRDDETFGQDTLFFTLGAVGGFALGVLLSARGTAAVRGLGERAGGVGTGLRERASGLRGRATGLRDRARGVAGRLRPAAVRREEPAIGALAALEDEVLDAFLADDVLSERGIDVGGLARGIVELSGTVWTQDEAERAVRLAQRVPGVVSVINRMEVEDLRRPYSRDEAERDAEEATEWTGRNVGMGRRRQGRETDPSRPDDSQRFRERAMQKADERQVEDEIGATGVLVGGPPARPGPALHYREDQLDNQDPYAGPGRSKHGARPVPEQPQALNAEGRVGEGVKPGVELALEAADVPVKPHGKPPRDDSEPR